jgi:hypothetical protein
MIRHPATCALLADVTVFAVYGICILETLQTALSGADLYHWFVTGFGNFEHLTTPYASAFDVPIMGSVVSLSVQFFFAYRIWVLGKKESWWLCALICLVSLSPSSGSGRHLITPIVLHRRRDCGVHRRCLCGALPFHIRMVDG